MASDDWTVEILDGRYRLDERIGKGATGEVWRATDLVLNQVVAVKRLHRGVDDPDARDRLLHEARLFARRRFGPHVVELHDGVFGDRHFFLVMEYFAADSLTARINREALLDPRTAADVGAQAARGLAALHAADIVHRDVAPGNILVAPDGTTKLTDFGLARIADAAPALSTEGFIVGTLPVLAPEVADGARSLAPADIFGLGASLVAAVRGFGPYGKNLGRRYLDRARDRAIDAGADWGALTPVLHRLLAADPADRPTAAEAADLLAGVADHEVPTTVPPAPTAASPANAAHAAPPSSAIPAQPRPPLAAPVDRPTPDENAAGAGGGRRIRWWPSRRRTRAAVVVAVTAVAATAIVVTQLVGPHDASAVPQAGALPTSPRPDATAGGATPHESIRDPRTADPCALTDSVALGRYGQPHLSAHYGNFNRCDVLIDPPTGPGVDVDIEILNSGPLPDVPTAAVSSSNGITVVRMPGEGSECDRMLATPDHYRVAVTVKTTDEGIPPDLCTVAETATGSALSTLSRGLLPRRTLPAASLAQLQACDLLDPATLARISPTDVANMHPGFGDWDCDWSTTDGTTAVEVRFDQDQPLTAADDGQPQTLAGRQAFVQPGGDGGHDCMVRIPYRTFADEDAEPAVEVVEVVVRGSAPTAQLCTTDVTLATAAAQRLG